MSLLTSPNDIILLIADEIDAEQDIASLTSTCRRVYCLLSDFLHQTDIRRFDSRALYWGIQHNRIDVVERMLDLGAQVNGTKDGCTPLDMAAPLGKTDVIKLLLNRGAEYRFSQERPWTPLMAAASEGMTDAVRVLLQHHGTVVKAVETEDRNYTKPPHWKFVSAMFGTSNPSLEKAGFEFVIPLFIAIAQLRDEVAEILIHDPRVNINYQDYNYMRTPLMWASTHNRPRVVKALLEAGADPNLRSPNHGTALYDAVSAGRLEIVKLLLADERVDVNS
ncbi:ankyrin repeat-containing domain protein [Aspergillus californicus]